MLVVGVGGVGVGIRGEARGWWMEEKAGGELWRCCGAGSSWRVTWTCGTKRLHELGSWLNENE